MNEELTLIKENELLTGILIGIKLLQMAQPITDGKVATVARWAAEETLSERDFPKKEEIENLSLAASTKWLKSLEKKMMAESRKKGGENESSK